MKKILKWLNNNLEDYIMVILTSFVVIITFLQVVMRYAFNNSLVWSEELARYIFIWIIYIGVSKAASTGAHLTVDAIDSILNKKEQILIDILADILFIIFAGIMVVFTVSIIMSSTRESAALGIPMSVVYSASAVGFSLTIFRLIQSINNRIKLYRTTDMTTDGGE